MGDINISGSNIISFHGTSRTDDKLNTDVKRRNVDPSYDVVSDEVVMCSLIL